MTGSTTALVITLLAAASIAPWVVRRLVPARERPDGAASLGLIRWTGATNALIATMLLAAGVASHGHLGAPAHLWRHDVWSALLFGGLAGLFLHLVGGGSPLPIASLRPMPRPSRLDARSADLGAVAVYLFGEVGSVVTWFAVGLPFLLGHLPRLLLLPLIAAGYGFGRAAAGQDHPLTGAIDGMLLGLLYLLTGSLVAVVVAHFLGDVLSYVSAASTAEDDELALEAGQPVLSSGEGAWKS